MSRVSVRSAGCRPRTRRQRTVGVRGPRTRSHDLVERSSPRPSSPSTATSGRPRAGRPPRPVSRGGRPRRSAGSRRRAACRPCPVGVLGRHLGADALELARDAPQALAVLVRGHVRGVGVAERLEHALDRALPRASCGSKSPTYSVVTLCHASQNGSNSSWSLRRGAGRQRLLEAEREAGHEQRRARQDGDDEQRRRTRCAGRRERGRSGSGGARIGGAAGDGRRSGGGVPDGSGSAGAGGAPGHADRGSPGGSCGAPERDRPPRVAAGGGRPGPAGRESRCSPEVGAHRDPGTHATQPEARDEHDVTETWAISDCEKPTGTWPAMALASSLIGAEARASSAERHDGPDQAHQQALEDERPADERVRRAHESHDLDLLGARHHRHPDGVDDDEQHRQRRPAPAPTGRWSAAAP